MVHVVTGAPVCEVGRYQRRGEWHGRLRQECSAGVRRVRGENGARRSAFGVVLREHLLRVRVRSATHSIPTTRPFRDGRTGRDTSRRAPPLAYFSNRYPFRASTSVLDVGVVNYVRVALLSKEGTKGSPGRMRMVYASASHESGDKEVALGEPDPTTSGARSRNTRRPLRSCPVATKGRVETGWPGQ
jgi:hypothetical protein